MQASTWTMSKNNQRKIFEYQLIDDIFQEIMSLKRIIVFSYMLEDSRCLQAFFILSIAFSFDNSFWTINDYLRKMPMAEIMLKPEFRHANCVS
jgi:hypothetical protein